MIDFSLHGPCQYGRNNSSRVKLSYFSPIIILGKRCEGGFLGGGGEVKEILTSTLVGKVRARYIDESS